VSALTRDEARINLQLAAHAAPAHAIVIIVAALHETSSALIVEQDAAKPLLGREVHQEDGQQLKRNEQIIQRKIRMFQHKPASLRRRCSTSKPLYFDVVKELELLKVSRFLIARRIRKLFRKSRWETISLCRA
jgi:hypothetical protein